MAKLLAERLEEVASQLQQQSGEPEIGAVLSLLFASEYLVKYLEGALVDLGINLTKANILYTLTLRGGTMTATDLSKSVRRSKQAITTSIDALVRDGLVKREMDADRRLRKVSITSKGLSLVKKTLPLRNAIAGQVFSCLDDEAYRLLWASLKQVENHMRRLAENGTLEPGSTPESR